MICNFKEAYPDFVKSRAGERTFFAQLILSGHKIHTMRDSAERWEKSLAERLDHSIHNSAPLQPVEMHLCTGARSKNYNCFKLAHYSGSQKIEMTKTEMGHLHTVLIDGHELHPAYHHLLWHNDGFTNERSFVEWFFHGVQPGEFITKYILHWSGFRYDHSVFINNKDRPGKPAPTDLSIDPIPSNDYKAAHDGQ